MSAKILKICLTIFVMLGISIGLTGCTEKVYVDRPYEVKLPVKGKVPQVQCYPKQATYTEEIKELRLCIQRYKDVIQNYNKD